MFLISASDSVSHSALPEPEEDWDAEIEGAGDGNNSAAASYTKLQPQWDPVMAQPQYGGENRDAIL